jgi:outer membrane protein assembly factor BamB
MMSSYLLTRVACGAAVLGFLTLAAPAADWPMWGGTPQHNMVSSEKGLFTPSGTGGPPPAAAIKWQAKLGGKSVGTPVVAAGRVFIGSSAWSFPGDTRNLKDGGAVSCFDEATGKPAWSLHIPRMSTKNRDFNFDHMGFGTCSTPVVEGKYLYIIGNRDDLLCLDAMGQADGNDGPFIDEGRYMTAFTLPDKPGRFDPKELVKLPTPVKVMPYDGDIVWRYDIVAELDSWPQDAASSSPLIVGDCVYASTANGVDLSHKNHPSPKAPDLVCLDKKTGKLLAVNENPLGDAVLHGQWSSPTLATVNGRDLILYGGGDGICYAYDAKPVPGAAGKPGLLKVVWQFDCCKIGRAHV